MDDIVKAAMAKWPKVPHCYGWLGLDARGEWYMRDDACQAAGSFASAWEQGNQAAKGSRLQHEKLIDFINRNYANDAAGQWYFQNGPQRVFVELVCTPVVWRVQQNPPDAFTVTDHSGAAAQVQASYLDEQGRLYLLAQRGQPAVLSGESQEPVLGLVHSIDMLAAANAIEHGLWQPQTILATDLPTRFGFVVSPQSLLLKV